MKQQSRNLRRIFPLLVLAMVHRLGGDGMAKPHLLRQRGRTRIEAESYSAASESFPYAESCRTCSAQQNLGHFWKNSWFEIHISVRRLASFSISMRTSSLKGTQIEVERVGVPPAPNTSLKIDALPTGDWSTYADTNTVRMILPAGQHRIRFENVQRDPANIDYITFAAEGTSVIRPPLSKGPDSNPLKGFGSGWWRNDPYATVGTQHLEWGKFEPVDDEFDWEYVEEVLDREGTRGRHCILQLILDWNGNQPLDANYLGPAWLLKQVGEHQGREDVDDPASPKIRATKYNNPMFLKESAEAIDALMDYLQRDPRTFATQVGLLGFWGEWHTFPRLDWNPSKTTKSKTLKTYLSNLGVDDLLQFNTADSPQVDPRPGMGYVNGQATLTTRGKQFGESVARRELWNDGPIGGEWPANMAPEIWNQFFQTNAGRDFIALARYSTILLPDAQTIAKLSPNWKQDESFLKMHRQMGYNFQVKQLRSVVDSQSETGKLHLEIEWHNAGIAPFYKNWTVQIALWEPNKSSPFDLINISTDPRKLGPSETITLYTVSNQRVTPNVAYRIGMRILQPGADLAKPTPWKLNARNTYIELANDLEVIDGQWDPRNALQGGWNVLGYLLPQQEIPKSRFFPFEGSYRTSAEQP